MSRQALAVVWVSLQADRLLIRSVLINPAYKGLNHPFSAINHASNLTLTQRCRRKSAQLQLLLYLAVDLCITTPLRLQLKVAAPHKLFGRFAVIIQHLHHQMAGFIGS